MARPMYREICATIEERGWAVRALFLPEAAIAALRNEAIERDAAGEFRAAGVGRAAGRIRRTDIRGDRTRWLDENEPCAAAAPLWEALGELRAALNESLFLGLDSFEGHYAIYPPGAVYRRHRDRFRDDDARVISIVLYLNRDWSAQDGGALRLQLDQGPHDILPIGGTLVIFLAERFEHEVLPAARHRLAVAGWFRRRV